MRDMPVRTRIPEGEEGEYVHPVNQRTYEVYANLTHPLIVDIHGRGIEGNYGYVEEMLAGDYDGLILKNCRVGKYHDMGDVVIARQSSQVKDTRNEDPTENPDIRYSIADEDSVTEVLNDEYQNTDDIPKNDPELEEGRVRMARSKQDFIDRSKVSKTIADLMQKLGLLGELPETNQISLFDFGGLG